MANKRGKSRRQSIDRRFRNTYNRLSVILNIRKIVDNRYEEYDIIDGIKCESVNSLLEGEKIEFVVIAMKNKQNIVAVAEWLKKNNFRYCLADDIIDEYQYLLERKQIDRYNQNKELLVNESEIGRLHSFISISVPVERCNLKCNYCYIAQNEKIIERSKVRCPSVKFIRLALSRKRLGGSALLNFCGEGETLLFQGLSELIRELLEEGHYISIITNAILEDRVLDIIKKAGDSAERLFFKCSLHYMQLKEKGLLDKFASTVKRIKNSTASFTVELVPEDALVPFIGEIIEYSIKSFGALPHVTVARDESKKGFPALTKMSKEKYREAWGVFNSTLFEVKMKTQEKQEKWCAAGKGTFILTLDSGEAFSCPYNRFVGNVYADISKPICFDAIGTNCKAPYCINAHAYQTLGIVPEIKEYTYLDVRDRVTDSGEHWVKPVMADFISQRISGWNMENSEK